MILRRFAWSSSVRALNRAIEASSLARSIFLDTYKGYNNGWHGRGTFFFQSYTREMKPEAWGPRLWGAFHIACLTGTISPEFLEEFSKVIPCPACSVHFRQLIESNPLPSMNQFEWSVDIHNQVNERIGKPLVSVDQARAMWSYPPPSTQFDFKIIFIVLLIVLLILFAFRK
jgi:hypothetical protein